MANLGIVQTVRAAVEKLLTPKQVRRLPSVSLPSLTVFGPDRSVVFALCAMQVPLVFQNIEEIAAFHKARRAACSLNDHPVLVACVAFIHACVFRASWVCSRAATRSATFS